jgi:hypothetical protein
VTSPLVGQSPRGGVTALAPISVSLGTLEDVPLEEGQCETHQAREANRRVCCHPFPSQTTANFQCFTP